MILPLLGNLRASPGIADFEEQSKARANPRGAAFGDAG